jgi:cytochrome P450
MTRSHTGFAFPNLGDISSLDLARPVQDLTERLRDAGSGMFDQPIGNQPAIFLADTALIDEVNDDIRWEKHLGPSLRRLRTILGDSLFTAYNDEPNWRTAHNILMPAFTKTAMQNYHDAMVDTIAELVAVWVKKSKVRSWLAIPAETNRLTIELVARAGMGHSFGKFNDPRENPFIAAVLRELAFADRHTLDVEPERASKHDSDQALITRTMADIVEARRHDPAAGEIGDFLDILLHSSDPDTGARLDESSVANQLLTLLVAGSETTANAIAFALHYLSTSPDVAHKAREEVDQLWPGAAAANIAFGDVDKLRYLRCVIDETLRLQPVAPGFFRQAKTDTTLGGVHEFRSGQWVFVHLIAAHRSRAWGDDADEFNPDRFLPDNLRQLGSRTYKPFGIGARACIGRRFAMQEMLLTLAAILRHFDIEALPDPALSVSEAMSLKPHGLQLRFIARDPD